MFTRVFADNYRCLANFEISLETLSVLLGPNGSGKSACLLLISKLRDFILGRGDSLDHFPAESLTRWDTRKEQTFEFGARLAHGDYLYRLRLHHQPERALNKIVEETLTLDGNRLFDTRDEKTHLYNDQYGGGAEFLPDWNVSGISRVHVRHDNTKLIAFREFLEAVLVLAINPALVSAVSAGKHPVTIPKPDCSDFAGWLEHIISAEAIVRSAAEESLSAGVLAGFKVFQATPSGDARILECGFTRRGAKSLKFRLDELSSGQIALVILETAVAFVCERGGSLLLDEPGNFLGLSEVRPLLTRLQDATREGRYQVILSAHHPIAIDFLAAHTGVWLDREPSGPTRQQRISVSEDLQKPEGRLRVSDLVARGWLSGLGVRNLSGPVDT